MEMRIRIFAITAALLLLTGSTTFAQQNSGSPYVQLRPLKSEPPLRFGTQKQLLVDNEMLFFYGGTRYAHSKPGPPIVDDGEYLKSTATTPAGKGHLVRRQNHCLLLSKISPMVLSMALAVPGVDQGRLVGIALHADEDPSASTWSQSNLEERALDRDRLVVDYDV